MEVRPIGEGFSEDELWGQEERLEGEEEPDRPMTRRETDRLSQANPEFVPLIQIPLIPKEAFADHWNREGGLAPQILPSAL